MNGRGASINRTIHKTLKNSNRATKSSIYSSIFYRKISNKISTEEVVPPSYNPGLHRISVAPMVDVSLPHFLYMLRLIGGSVPQIYTEMFHPYAIINFVKEGSMDSRLGLNGSHPDVLLSQPLMKDRNEKLISQSRSILEDKKELNKMGAAGRENHVVQLGGSEPQLLSDAVKILIKEKKYLAINLNLGCPSPATQAGEFGAILLKDVDRVIDCVQAMESAAAGRVPITVKCRLGVDDLDSDEFILNFVDKLSTKTNVNHFIMHARKCLLKGLSPAKNRTVPPLNYERVHLLAKSFPHLSFTMNGGIRTIEEARNHLNTEFSNLNGIMLGRKIMDCPAFIADLVKEFITPDFSPLPLESIYSLYVEYLLEQLARGHRPSMLFRPTMYLFPAKWGRVYRHRLMQTPILRDFKPTTIFSPEVDGPRVRDELLSLARLD